jgi:RNA polymerase sigma-70 factor (ECF subfamily)
VSKIDDILLVSRATAFRDKRAFGQLVEKYQSPVRHFFLGQTLGNEPLSDDLAQDTFVKAWLSIGSFRGTASFSTWLFRIAFNTFYDYKRSQHTEGSLESVEAMSKATVNGSGELHFDLYRAMEILSPPERLCITLQCIDGQPLNHIVSITGMAEGTIKSHLHRGKEKLATYLKQNGYDRK